jgi:hypothetical protein
MDMWCDVDTAVTVPVNLLALIDDTDFKSREVSIAYNQAGMDLVWNFQTTAGVTSQTAVTPTTAGVYDWTHSGDGMYKIEIPASGGVSINNDTEGFGWFSGICTGVLAWRGPVIGFRAAALNNALVDGGDILDVSLTEINGDSVVGNLATLTLKQFHVSNSAGDAIVAASTGSNGHGINISGNGSGEGISSTGGATGHGAEFIGGATSGSGIEAVGGGSTGNGISFMAGGGSSIAQSAGIFCLGINAGSGIATTGGATGGDGIIAIGGSTSGDGINAYGDGSGVGLRVTGTSNNEGILATGQGSGEGIRGMGGATGNGAQFIGGASSGNGLYLFASGGNEAGLYSEGNGGGAGIEAKGGATNGNGISAIGDNGTDVGTADGLRLIAGGGGDGLNATGNGAGSGIVGTGGATGHGALFSGGATSGNGLRAAGTATDSGLYAVGGAQGDGIAGVGGATGGAGIAGTAPTAGHGLDLVGGGSGDGIAAIGGTTGVGLRAWGGATSGDGADIRAQTSGDGMQITGAGGGLGLNAAEIGTPTDLGGGASLADNNSDIAGATFSTATDSNEAIRDRGDAAWTTGAGGSPLTKQEVRDSMLLAPSLTIGVGSIDEHLDTIEAATTAIKAVTDNNNGGIIDANLLQINDASVVGNAATLTLKQFHVSNSAGDAIVAASTGSNGDGIAISGNGTGHGISSTGGLTGTGATFTGGATSGAGIIAIASAGNSSGLVATGTGSGDGIAASGGSTNGHGISATGGSASSQAGIYATGNAGILAEGGGGETDGPGIRATGAFTSSGIEAVGGVTGDGFEGTGGATSGDGFAGTAPGTGSGMHLIGGAVSGEGLRISALADDSSGTYSTGNGLGAGLRVAGGETGHGIMARGGDTSGDGINALANNSGDGISATAAGNGDGISGTGIGTGAGMILTGGATGHGIAAVGGATSGDGINASTPVSGQGINATGRGTGNGILATAGVTGDGANFVGGATSGHGLNLSNPGTGLGLNTAEIGTPTTLGSGASLADNNQDIAGATFNTATDSNEAIRDRGDAAWTTGAGGAAITKQEIRDSMLLSPSLTIGVGSIDEHLDTIEAATTAIKAVTDNNNGGIIDANMMEINDLSVVGNLATLTLKQLHVVNNSGPAILASSTGGNGHGMQLSGNGSGEGLSSLGGATGHGIKATGGATSGDGIVAIATTSGNGMQFTAAGNGHGIISQGSGSGEGIYGIGGATGHGIAGDGGATSGSGIKASAVNGNNAGISATGIGSGDGINTTGGATGHGIRAIGGATSGHGINAHAQLLGHGISATAAGDARHGIYALSGASTSGNGIRAVSQATDGNGISASGAGTGFGLYSQGGPTGDGIKTLGGATSGDGINASAANSGVGIRVLGAGANNGLDVRSGSGATGDAIYAAAQSTNGDGVNFVATGTGSGIDANAPGTGSGIWSHATSGAGIYADGGGAGAGILTVGGETDGNGISTVGDAGTDFAGGHGVYSEGNNGGTGIYAVGQGTGHGLHAQSGAGATGNGINALASSTDGDGMRLAGTGGGLDINASPLSKQEFRDSMLLTPSLTLGVGSVDELVKTSIAITEHQRGSHTGQPIGNIFYVDPTNGGTYAAGYRGGISDPISTVQDCHDNLVTDSNHDIIILLSGASGGPTTLTEDVTISKRYLFIRGPGRDFLWTRSGSGDTIAVTADGVELSGFQLETAATGAGHGIQLTGADFLLVHHVWINQTQGDGINILRGENCQIRNNNFFETGQGGSGEGIHILGTAGSSNNNVIHDNHFFDCAGDSIKIENGTTNNTQIFKNGIEGSTGYGINIGASSNDAVVHDNVLGNNTSGNINDVGTTSVIANNYDVDTELTAQHGAGAWTGGGSSLTKQEVRDSMLLPPTLTIGIGSVDEHLDTIEAAIGTGVDLGDGTTIANMLTGMAGETSDAGTFSRATDSLEAIVNSGASGLTKQNVRDAMLMPPTLTIGVGSIDEHLDTIETAVSPLTYDAIGNVNANMQAIAHQTAEAVRLQQVTEAAIHGKVNAIPLSSTALIVKELDNDTDADLNQANLLQNRVLTFTSGNARGQSVGISAQAAAASDPITLTVTTMINWANIAADDEFVIT